MVRKRKNHIDTNQYKNFHSPKKNVNKMQQTKRNNKKRYFEHDTRTAGGGGGGGGSRICGVSGGGGVKRIKFNNEISIYESNESRSIASAAVNVNVKKRSRNKSTKQLQKQLIETQKRLQRQLIELQQHQHNSFLALLCATECNNSNHLNYSKSHNHNQCTLNSNAKDRMLVNAACTHFTATNHNRSKHECINYDTSHSLSSNTKKITTKKMANGINRSLIPCDETLHSNIELASTKSLSKSPCKLCAAHADCSPQRSSVQSSSKPVIKSIILSTSNQPLDHSSALKQLKIKQEPVNDENDEMSHLNVPKSLKKIKQSSKGTVNLGNGRSETSVTKHSFTPPRDSSSQLKTKEMLGKIASVATDYRLSPRDSKRRSHQKLPGRWHLNRRKSKSTNRSIRSRSSDSDRFSRRRSSSRERTPRRRQSRRSLSRRSASHESRSRSRSRHSRDTRSYGSTTSTDSSDSDRRSNCHYREQRGAGDSKRSGDYHDTNSRGSQNKHRSKSPMAACDRKAFNYQNSIISALQRNNGRNEKPPTMPLKRFAIGATFTGTQRPETSKKYAMKPKPIVKLHSEPGTDSDDDDKIVREYEELLTFETNEDERREQRLLKALSDIAAKAKQKIQLITSESNNVTSLPPMVNSIQHDVCAMTTNVKPFSNIVRTASIDKSNDRRSTSCHNDDNSPKLKHSSRRSRKDDDANTKGCKSPGTSRTPSIPRRRGSPSFLDRRRITSARKKPIPYQRVPTGKTDDEWNSSDKD